MNLKQKFEKFKEDNSHIIKEKELRDTSFLKKFSRYASIPIAKFIDKYTSLSPNSVTILTNIFSLIPIYFFYLGDYTSIMIGGSLFLLIFILDYVDGSLARIQNRGSNFGGWLDHSLDMYRMIFFFFAIAFGVYRQTGDWLVFIFIFWATVAFMMRKVMAVEFGYEYHPEGMNVIKKEKSKLKFITFFFYEGPFITYAIVVGSFLNQLYWLMLLFAVMGWLYCFAMHYKFSRILWKYERK